VLVFSFLFVLLRRWASAGILFSIKLIGTRNVIINYLIVRLTKHRLISIMAAYVH
jgi:hypothetical protein